ASASQPAEFSELNLHGLLPYCVRFAPTGRPVNGNTRFRPVCSTVTGRDSHPLDSFKKFHRLIFGSSSSKLSQRDNNVGGVKHCLSTLRPALGKERHFALCLYRNPQALWWVRAKGAMHQRTIPVSCHPHA